MMTDGNGGVDIIRKEKKNVQWDWRNNCVLVCTCPLGMHGEGEDAGMRSLFKVARRTWFNRRRISFSVFMLSTWAELHKFREDGCVYTCRIPEQNAQGSGLGEERSP